MNQSTPVITSLQNPAVKRVVRLRRRSARNRDEEVVVEGYRELRRAVECGVSLGEVFFCPPLFLGENEPALLEACRSAGARPVEVAEAPFRKMAYRDRPDGVLGLARPRRYALADIEPGTAPPLYLVAEHIEKPGNLGTMLRTADATGCDAVLVCDRKTDLFNPNVVRASIGTLFTRPVVETDAEETRDWLRNRGVQIVAASPHAERLYADVEYTVPTAVVVGAEQYGLEDAWFGEGCRPVRIPMLGEVDSLNVSAAATVLLYEAVRQRLSAS